MPARTAKHAERSGLGLFIFQWRSTRSYMLYDAKELLDDVLSANSISILRNKNDLKEYIIAHVNVTAESAPVLVPRSFAEQGYGPFLFDVVMFLEDGIVVDGSSSPDAQKMWNFYFYSRDDVTKERVLADEEMNPLNCAYLIDRAPNFSQLVGNSDASLGQIADTFNVGHHFFAQSFEIASLTKFNERI